MSLPTYYQQYIALSRYARWNDELGRRETWDETVSRYFDFFTDHLWTNHHYSVPFELRQELQTAVTNLEIMPSMRCMMTAGRALDRDNAAAFNCSFLPIDCYTAFDEMLYLLMCGSGVGFSVERIHTDKLPKIASQFQPVDACIVVEDSRIGWAESTRHLIQYLHRGLIPSWDTSLLRPKGSILKTFGGRASGPEPLIKLFNFLVKVFTEAAGDSLKPIECHDICCMIADCVVSGGTRRSALISLSDLDDHEMQVAKMGEWWLVQPERAFANNSAVYTETPPRVVFDNEWHNLVDSRSGERGIFSREAAIAQIERSNEWRRQFADAPVRSTDFAFGCNPCSEIILRPYEQCNLTEAIIRAEDTPEQLYRKVRLAAILGTWQSTLTNFRYINDRWRRNAEEERLLGVSLTGVMDNTLTNGRMGVDTLTVVLNEMKREVVRQNLDSAEDIGINASVATTCGKPSGTVSQLVNSASGMHGRHSHYYIRRIREDEDSPVGQFLVEQGVPVERDFYKQSNLVFSFPVKAPEGSIMRDDLTAVEQLEHWLTYQLEWCEHKPSITITVKDHEWQEVADWVYDHFEHMSGVSFLPYDGHTYQQAPYEEIDQNQYESLKANMPVSIDWDKLSDYEREDNTAGSRELACTAGGCEI